VPTKRYGQTNHKLNLLLRLILNKNTLTNYLLHKVLGILNAGTKGHSGRKTHYDEKLISDLVNLSVKTCFEYLNDPLLQKIKKQN